MVHDADRHAYLGDWWGDTILCRLPSPMVIVKVSSLFVIVFENFRQAVRFKTIMEAPYSTLEEYGELLRIACEKARRAKAHTCECCAQISIEIPDDAGPIIKDGCRTIHCAVKGLSRNLEKRSRRDGCRLLSQHFVGIDHFPKNHDGSLSATVVLQEVRKGSYIGSLIRLVITDPAGIRPRSRGYTGDVFFDEGPNLILLFESEMFD